MPRVRSRLSRRRIAFIGASYLFCHTAVRDMLLNGQLDESDLVLYDLNPEPLKLEHDVIARMIRQRAAGMTVRMARSRSEAIRGADYVVVSVLAGGLELAEKEDRLCRRHGIRHTVGDTVGPMCAARVLRQAPLLVDIARDMEKLCPGAPLLSPTNPMTALVTAVHRYTSVRCIGICHGTHFALEILAQAYRAKEKDVRVNVVGVNHLGFIDGVTIGRRRVPVERAIDRILKQGGASYDDPAGHTEGLDCTIRYAKLAGYLPNNGDHHFLEFFPWYLAPHAFKNGRNKYKIDHRLLNVPARRRRKKFLKKLLSRWAYGPEPIPDMHRAGGEHIEDIILGLEGRHRAMTLDQLHLNVPNAGSVPNLPDGAILELTVEPAKRGFRPVKNPALDPYRWGVLAPLVALNELSAKAAIERDKQAFVRALLLDPLLHDIASLPRLAEGLWDLNRAFAKPLR
ncbi:MAG: hypothetical protein M5U26_15165 [Planctomycetota bacterium]|nr:hypothetical protein [Planctomycetota bacterium]